MIEEQYETEIDLFELLGILLQRWYLVIGAIFVFTTATFIYVTFMLDDVYTAQASMVVLVQTEDQSDAANFQFGQRLVDTYAELAKSNRVIDLVKNDLNLSLSNSEIRDMMEVSSVSDTIVIKLRVESNNRMEAMNIANSVVRVMQVVSTDFQGFDNVEILDNASLPTSPTGPNRPLYVAIGFVLGALVGIMGIFGIEFLDKTIKTPKDIENKLGLRVLGVVPNYDLEEEEK